MNQFFKVDTPDQYSPVIAYIFDHTKQNDPLVITLSGDLGAGKTTFVQELGKFLGVTDPVTSPTFTLMKQYVLDSEYYEQLVHIDAYRIENEDEVVPLHLESLFNQPKTIICIEWPEKISNVIPAKQIKLHINITDNEQREVNISLFD